MGKHGRSARTARFHHDGELQANSRLTLSRTASHHLVTVLRTRQGDCIELFNGDGRNYRATVVETGQRTTGRCAELQLDDAWPAHTESPVRTTLLQGISRGDRMDTCIRQSVELGVNHVQPLYTRHSAKVLDEKRTVRKCEHWQGILVSACEQSGRACLPTLAAPVSLALWLEKLATGTEQKLPGHTFVLDPAADVSLVSYLQSSLLREIPVPASRQRQSRAPARDTSSGSGLQDIGLIIGPESGLDSDEIESAVNAGAIPVTAGPRILRTETAGPASITMLQAVLGDLS